MARTLKTSNGPGHNSGMIDRDALKVRVERGVSLRREQMSIGEDLKELCKDADDAGICSKKEIRRLIAEALMDQDVLSAQLERMDMLRHALGQLQDTPLGEAAVKLDANHRRAAAKRKLQTDIEDAIGVHNADISSWDDHPEPPGAA